MKKMYLIVLGDVCHQLVFYIFIIRNLNILKLWLIAPGQLNQSTNLLQQNSSCQCDEMIYLFSQMASMLTLVIYNH